MVVREPPLEPRVLLLLLARVQQEQEGSTSSSCDARVVHAAGPSAPPAAEHMRLTTSMDANSPAAAMCHRVPRGWAKGRGTDDALCLQPGRQRRRAAVPLGGQEYV